ncbi:helix-turn-helix domain-containing protein [Nannocystis pusilla]|uniref:helix-turn-helix domain-containing protein n=1 Tax=Nannocystis pusilla TaxID=889268 RepID=UPI003DA4D685
MEISYPYNIQARRGRPVLSNMREVIGVERHSAEVSSRPAAELPPPLMTVEEVALLLRTSKGAVYARYARGGIPGALRLGRTLRFDPRIIAQWLSANSASAGGQS